MKNKILSFLSLLLLCASNALAADKFDGYTVTNEGAWCWFADPRALHYENEAGTINASYIGYIDVHGNIKATQMDFLTGQRNEVLVRSYFQPDDHNNPTFLVLPDERIMIFYSRHTDEACFFYRVSRKPGDITTLGEEKVIKTANNTTYPSPFILSDDPQHFYLCWRGINWHPTIGRYTLPDENDNVQSAWGPYQIVQSTGARPYAKYYSNGKDKIYMTYTTGHPDNEQPNWVYFNAVNLNAVENTDGSVSVSPTLEDIRGTRLSTIASGPFKVYKTSDYKNSYPYTVVDAPSNYRDWVWQIACDAEGRPVIAMVRINGGKSQHEYFYAKWTGSAWRLTDLADGGGRFHSSNTEYCYSGGEALDPANPNIIYLSIPTEGETGQKVYEIWKYTLDDNGVVTSKEPVTRNSTKNNVRPFVLPGSQNSPLRLGWMNGDYDYWMVKKDYPRGYPTALHCDYEWVENIHAYVDAPALRKYYGGRIMTAEDYETPELPQTETFTLNVGLKLDASAYFGTLVESNAFSYGVAEEGALPYVKINGTVYNSTNQLYTSDNWALNSNGTSGDRWPTPLGAFNLTLTYDGHVLTVYRNGWIDSKIEVEGLTTEGLRIGGYQGTLETCTFYKECLEQDEVKYMMRRQALDMLYLPEQACTDVVLPGTLGGENLVWTSDNEEILAADGSFRAPETETQVTLIARAGQTSRTFVLTAMPRNIERNILAYYAFEEEDIYSAEDESTKVKDLSGCGRDLMLHGSATANGVLDLSANKATSFATNGYATLPAGLLDSLRSYTVLFLATPASLSAAPRFYDFGFSSGNSLFGRANTLAAGIKLNGGTTTMVSGNKTLTAGTTYKMAVTYDARTRQTVIYVDGALVGSGTDNVNEAWQIAAQAADSRNYIGRTQWWDTSFGNDNGDYVGTMDEFRVYNTALTLEEIAALQGIHIDNPALNVDRTDCLANPGFEASFTVMPNSGVDSDRALYVPEGWTIDYTGRDKNDMSVLNFTCLYYNLFTSIPCGEELGSNSYLVRQKWGTSSISLNQQNDTLPAGYYSLEASLWQSGLGGQATVWVKEGNGDALTATAPSATGTWEQAAVMFTSDGFQQTTFGCTARHTSDGSEKFLGFDNFRLWDVTANRQVPELLTLLARMVQAAERLQAAETLPEPYLSRLQEAARAASALTESASQTEAYEAFCALRDALTMARNPLPTGISAISVDGAATPSPVYTIDGRLVGTDCPEKAGLYIMNGKKKVVR